MHPTLTHSEDAHVEHTTLHLILHRFWSLRRAATCQGFPAHRTPAARHLFHVGKGLVTSPTDPSIASCTMTLHCFMTPKAQSAIHTSRKTGVSKVLLFRFQWSPRM